SLAARWIVFDPFKAVDPTGLASWFLYFTMTTLFLVLLNAFLNKTIPRRINVVYQLCLYLAFQCFLLLSWTRLLPSLGPEGGVSMALLALVETALSFVPFHYIRHGIRQRPATRQAFWPLALLVYLELAAMVYAASALALGTVESVLLALGSLFLLSIAEFHAVKCIKPPITWTLNLASYIPFMVALFLTWTGNMPLSGPLGRVSVLCLALVETALAFSCS
ncbi:MAG: hypothetical protein GYA24_19515, partial [Candidatus Lokiarchaeota archaeon]|nr:hypothetical protein [Candidatus Lokiarchaeota archaeon]